MGGTSLSKSRTVGWGRVIKDSKKKTSGHPEEGEGGGERRERREMRFKATNLLTSDRLRKLNHLSHGEIGENGGLRIVPKGGKKETQALGQSYFAVVYR